MASMKPREMASPKSGAGANLILLLGAMELVEDAIDLLRRNAATLIDDLQLDGLRLLPALDQHRGLRRCIFGGIVEEIEQHLLEQHRIELEHWQVFGDVDLHAVLNQDFSSPFQHRADDLTDIVPRRIRLDRAGLEPRHVEQIGDEAVEPL